MATKKAHPAVRFLIAFLIVIAVGLVWIPLRRSRVGLSLYAVGSDALAAFLRRHPIK